jgi:hypothetical protein
MEVPPHIFGDVVGPYRINLILNPKVKSGSFHL